MSQHRSQPVSSFGSSTALIDTLSNPSSNMPRALACPPTLEKNLQSLLEISQLMSSSTWDFRRQCFPLSSPTQRPSSLSEGSIARKKNKGERDLHSFMFNRKPAGLDHPRLHPCWCK
ncbi:hypothetical protein AOLI_G00048810 [Acnodon oligacanthus]